MGEKVISINSTNTDYWQWGRNCAILQFDGKETANIISTDKEITSENYNLFYEGYHSKEE